LVKPSALDSLSVEKFALQLKVDISNGAKSVIAFELNGKTVGPASGNTQSKNYDSDITGLYVSPKAQQGGVGSYLFDEMKFYFKSQNLTNMIVWTLLGAPNNKYYSKNNPVEITHRDVIISGVKYKGIGFVYSL
jgi:ribosomal protein S18 acetylase RimI-like enzyme